MSTLGKPASWPSSPTPIWWSRLSKWASAFKFSHIRLGFRQCIPVGLSITVYGSVFGMLAAQKGMSAIEVLFMGATVFAGAAQFVVIDMWHDPLPIIPIVLATLAVNLRYVLACATLQSILGGLSNSQKLFGIFFVCDENWAITMASEKDGLATPGFLLGGGLACYFFWLFGSVFGQQMGGLIKNPEKIGLDFSFTAAFIALTVGMWKGKKDIAPWFIAAAVAGMTWAYLPGKWYILTGGIAGALFACFQSGEQGVKSDVC